MANTSEIPKHEMLEQNQCFTLGNDISNRHLGEVEAFPGKDDQGMLLEGPLRTRDSDYLRFNDYAEVLADRLQDPGVFTPDGGQERQVSSFS